MQRIIMLLAVTLLPMLFIPANISKAEVPRPQTTVLAAATKSAEPAGKASWQKKWDTIVTAAKKEGEVEIYLNAPTDTRIVLSEAFRKKFGIKLNIMTGSGRDLTVKLVTENQSGINQVDVFMPGATSTVDAKKSGVPLAPIEPMLILPEVRDKAVWFGGRLPFFDSEGTVFTYLNLINPDVFYNTDLVKEGEITSYTDLLKPQWKGKTVAYDPSIAGAALEGSYFLSREWGSSEKVFDYLSSLIKQQDALITKDMRQQVEWVARGKYLVALWPQLPATSQFLQTGAHIAAAKLKEKGRLTSSNGALGMPAKAPHPNAAVVFLNWFLSREGQALAVKAIGVGSARVDVAPEGVNPMYIPKSGEKYFSGTEETFKLRPQFQEGMKKFMEELNK